MSSLSSPSSLVPERNPRLWLLHAASVPGAWRGDAPLADSEARAFATLAERLARPDRFELLERVRESRPAPDAETEASLAALDPRARRVFEDASPALDRWEDALRHGPRPAWLAPQQEALDRFMGADPDRSIRVFLLPSPAELSGTVWQTFFGIGCRALRCGPEPVPVDSLFEDLVHTAAHAAQPGILDGHIAAILDTPEGAALAALFDATPVAEWHRQLQMKDPGIGGYVREIVVHALAYQGALREESGLPPLDDHWAAITAKSERVLSDPVLGREQAGLYDAWELAGSALLQPLTRTYLRERRPLDRAYVREAFAAFDSLHRTWERTLAASPAGAPNR